MKLSRGTITKIKEMAQLLDEESIGKTFNVPADVVRDILLDKYEPDNNELTSIDAKIEVIEKTRFVRNKTVTALAPGGGQGITTIMTALAIQGALTAPGKRPVVVLDLADIPKIPVHMGFKMIENTQELPIPTLLGWPQNMLVGDTDIYEYFTVRHPGIYNLHLMPGVLYKDDWSKITPEQILSIIRTCQRAFAMVLIELPSDPRLYEPVLNVVDAVLLVIRDDYPSLEGVSQLISFFDHYKIMDKLFPILNKTDGNIAETRKVLKLLHTDMTFEAAIPDINGLGNYIYAGERHPIIKDQDSVLSKEMRHIIDLLCPDWSAVSKQAAKGFKGLLRGIFQ